LEISTGLQEVDQDILNTVDSFCLFDDNFMSLVFERNTEATEFLLNIILERDDMEVIEVVGQREYKNPVIGGRAIMCKAVEELVEKRAESSRLETLFRDVSNLMETMKLTLEQAMNALKISESDKAVLMKRF
jgi:hypothetical protein